MVISSKGLSGVSRFIRRAERLVCLDLQGPESSHAQVYPAPAQGAPGLGAGTDPGPSPFPLLQSIRVSTGRGDPREDPPSEELRKGDTSVVLGWEPDTWEA